MTDTNVAVKKLDELLGAEEFEFEGQKVTLDEIKRWRDSRSNMEKDYTRKTQQVADLKRTLEQQIDLVSPYLQMHEFFETNPEKRDLLDKIIAGEQIDGKTPEKKPDDDIKRLSDEISKLSEKFSTQEQEVRFAQEVKTRENAYKQEMDALLSKYPKMDSDVVLAKTLVFSNKENVNDEDVIQAMGSFAKQSHEREIEKIDKEIKDYLAKKTSSHPTEGTGGTLGSAHQTPKYDKDSMLKGDTRREAEKFLREYNKP